MAKKVFVGLSGGVDSAVSAALLQEAGYDVTGVFIKIWQPEFIECTWREDRLDAMRVAAALKIPFLEIDLSDEYKKEVVNNMIELYTAGKTPNPDVLCNEKIKFGHFQKWALSRGADMIATGHYARVEHVENRARLFRGSDAMKDQSYFLYRLGQAELSHAFFPVGAYTKKEIRAEALRRKLPVAQKPDSQGLCFVGDITLPEFLNRYISAEVGDVLNTDGEVVGKHEGAALYTIGQRHGFKLTHHYETPVYICAIKAVENVIVVSTDRNGAARISTPLESLHWIGSSSEYMRVTTSQTRYRETPVSVHLQNNILHFAEPHVVSAGQSAVFYDNEECLGGGVIQ